MRKKKIVEEVPETPITDSDIKLERTEKIVKANQKFENIPWYDYIQVSEYDADPPWEGGKCVNIWGIGTDYFSGGSISIPISVLKRIVAEYEAN